MSFIDSYKHLEKLCGEVLNDNRRISAYIDEMIRTPNGSFYVKTWEEDLKKLKHYRWVRNQISHEPSCNEFNMCEPGDALWLDNFYARIMHQTDPLSLYHKATAPRATPKAKQPTGKENTSSHTPPTVHENKSSKRRVGVSAFLIATFFIIVSVIVWIAYHLSFL